jgi:DNA-binding CsgD family transcriptional regulator
MRTVSEPPGFTRRETEILALLAVGLSTDEVGRELHISKHTVTHHIGKMMNRVEASNRTELVARGYALGVLRPMEWPPRAGEPPYESGLRLAGADCRRCRRRDDLMVGKEVRGDRGADEEDG